MNVVGQSEGVKETKAPSKPPERWGVSSAAFYAYHRLKPVRIALSQGGDLVGTLIGVDKFDLVLELDDRTAILVPKHAVRWIKGTQRIIQRNQGKGDQP
jgi:sRNA-binding regulator protein Hfq